MKTSSKFHKRLWSISQCQALTSGKQKSRPMAEGGFSAGIPWIPLARISIIGDATKQLQCGQDKLPCHNEIKKVLRNLFNIYNKILKPIGRCITPAESHSDGPAGAGPMTELYCLLVVERGFCSFSQCLYYTTPVSLVKLGNAWILVNCHEADIKMWNLTSPFICDILHNACTAYCGS